MTTSATRILWSIRALLLLKLVSSFVEHHSFVSRPTFLASPVKVSSTLRLSSPNGGGQDVNDDSSSNDHDKIQETRPLPTIIPDIQEWMTQRFEMADWLEIRLEATLVSCYVLSRFLWYDIATGAKSIPGWELQDWVRILSTISSAILLSACWTGSGLLVTQSFEVQETTTRSTTTTDSSSASPPIWLVLTLVNVLVATPLWLWLEQVLQFAPPGLEVYDMGIYLTSGLGLASIMVVAKLLTQDSSTWR